MIDPTLPDWANTALNRKVTMPPRTLPNVKLGLYTLFLAAFTMVICLVVVPAAFAEGTIPQPQGGLTLDSSQTYVALIGALVPLATYVLNHYAPWVSEPAKALFLVIVTAVAAGLYQALSSGGIGFNASTVQILGTSIFSSLLAHKLLWAPSGISAKLKAGTNAQATA